MKALVATMALGALAGCGSQETTKTQGAAFQQVLPGSASDAMLPYDTATSAPPLAPPTYEAGEPSSIGSRRSAPAEDDTVPDAQATGQ